MPGTRERQRAKQFQPVLVKDSIGGNASAASRLLSADRSTGCGLPHAPWTDAVEAWLRNPFQDFAHALRLCQIRA